ncbi:MAG: substrate-binding domain-containing protein [Chloroflexi bacterium]|nr:substrate-binding domain-containing protein [Chloroflexota bacterium]
MNYKKLVSLLVVLLLVVTTAAAQDAPGELTIGALWLDASEFYTGVRAGIEAGAAESDITINLLGNNSQGDAAIEAEQMQTLIGAGVDAIIISAVSETSSVALIEAASEAGIPVICYNTCIAQEDAERLIYTWITGDHYQQGAGVGKATGEYFVAAGVEAPQIAVVSCERYGACQQRIAGFTDALLELVPGAVIVDNQEALEVDKAEEVATNMLTAHPDIDAFYGEAGNMVAGAAAAIELAGRAGEIVVFGHDISPTTAQLLLDGQVVKYINAMIAADFGRTALDLAVAAVMGEPSPGVIYNMTPKDFFSDRPDEVEAWLATQSGEAAAAPEELTIGALWLDASEFYTGVRAGIEAGAAESDLTINLLGNNSQGDAAIEAEQMQTLIGAGVDAIIISAVSESSSVALIEAASEAGIPVICYNTCIAQEDAERLIYTWITGDHYQQGAGVGKATGEYFVAAGVEAPQIAVVSCERYGACQQRIAGFTDALLELVPGAVIVDNQEALEVDKAEEVATNMLTAHPDIDAFYGEAGNMVAGAAAAIELAGRAGEIVVFGHDISPTTAQLLLDGQVVKYINAMIAADFGRTALDLAVAAVMGEPSPGVIYNMTPKDFFSDRPDEVEAWLATQG